MSHLFLELKQLSVSTNLKLFICCIACFSLYAMAFLVSVFRFKESESFLMAISNYFVYLFKALVFSSILVLGAGTGIIIFLLFFVLVLVYIHLS